MADRNIDPFDAAKDEVMQKLNELTALWELYQEQKQGISDVNDYTMNDLTRELSKNCKTVEYYMKGLERAVQVAEK
jgi:hypothetical protein